MIVDKQEHKDFLLELMKTAQYPGHVLELAVEVKKALEQSRVEESVLNVSDGE